MGIGLSRDDRGRRVRDGLDVNQAVDVFWFYFGYAGLFTLHDDNGWSYERAELWLYDEASRALLRDRGRQFRRSFVRKP